jgi:hypothetical protein
MAAAGVLRVGAVAAHHPFKHACRHNASKEKKRSNGCQLKKNATTTTSFKSGPWVLCTVPQGADPRVGAVAAQHPLKHACGHNVSKEKKSELFSVIE